MMLVILMNDQLIQPKAVCQGCLMADQQGKPRWHRGKLLCGRALQCPPEKCSPEQDGNTCSAPGNPYPHQYECQMGFRITHIDE